MTFGFHGDSDGDETSLLSFSMHMDRIRLNYDSVNNAKLTNY